MARLGADRPALARLLRRDQAIAAIYTNRAIAFAREAPPRWKPATAKTSIAPEETDAGGRRVGRS